MVSLVVKNQQSEQPRHAAIAIPKRVNAKKVEDKTGDRQKGRNLLLVQAVPVGETEFFDGGGYESRFKRLKADFPMAVRENLDDLILRLLPFAGISNGPPLR
jgi:hypothetical protein